MGAVLCHLFSFSFFCFSLSGPSSLPVPAPLPSPQSVEYLSEQRGGLVTPCMLGDPGSVLQHGMKKKKKKVQGFSFGSAEPKLVLVTSVFEGLA